MNTINKQKFLAELGKLLTFMYEEDRQTALAMYVKMFEDTEDEQALLQALVSPTRQAVIVARAYNAKMRKLQVEAQSREETGERVEDETTPDYILAIHKVYEEAVPDRSAGSAPMEDQFSLFEEDVFSEEDADAQPDESAEEAPVEADLEDAAEPEEPAVTGEAETPVEEPEAHEEDLEPLAAPEAAEAAPVEAVAAAAPLFVLDDDETKAEEEPADKDALDEFLADFSIEGDPLSPEEDEEEEASDEEEDLSDKAFELDDEADEGEDDLGQPVPTATVRKARPLLLILYIILAIPITLALICVLLIPTLFFLGLAVSAIAAGAAFFVTAFSGFPVLADILIVLGAALIILALGLLFLWIFIWFIGGAIVGLIRGVVSLGARWCYKEVAA
ncbi:MAG: hypothetical protein IJ179_06850 [Oscillospiraceae bacterium]|nr:hypothetical protein [Oscillospiraceae bacterium]